MVHTGVPELSTLSTFPLSEDVEDGTSLVTISATPWAFTTDVPFWVTPFTASSDAVMNPLSFVRSLVLDGIDGLFLMKSTCVLSLCAQSDWTWAAGIVGVPDKSEYAPVVATVANVGLFLM